MLAKTASQFCVSY